jgi:hypothetical protein
VVVALAVGTLPFLASLSSGRFNLPTTSVAESLGALAPTSAGGYRVLWLGDPTVAPVAGWSVAPGLEAATSTDGLPGGATLFTPPDSGASDVLLNAVQLALQGRTVRLGQLLAPAGISTIVVMNTSAPELADVQSVPLRSVPLNLVAALSRQTDLSLELQTRSVEVFSNSLFHGIVAQSSVTSTTGWVPVLNGTFLSGPVSSGATVIAGFAPASAFALDVNGSSAARHTSFGWVPTYQVGSYHEVATGRLVLHRIPWNGLLALLTLGLWTLVWLGFGWVQRLEWLFTRRQRTAPSARHARRES